MSVTSTYCSMYLFVDLDSLLSLIRMKKRYLDLYRRKPIDFHVYI